MFGGVVNYVHYAKLFYLIKPSTVDTFIAKLNIVFYVYVKALP